MPHFLSNRRTALARAVAFMLIAVSVAGCRSRDMVPSPVRAGYNTRDLIDLTAQAEAADLFQGRDTARVAQRLQTVVREIVAENDPEALTRPPRDVLCLSGGGSYGAFSAGILYGWTRTGRRPCFDVVTGISTGALIAPYAFLGPEYDEDMRRLYTTLTREDIYRTQPIRGLFRGGLADTTPLSELIDRELTPELIARIAAEHAKGRRLYVGTTELEGRRLVVWDIGAIAERGDRRLIHQVLLGSSAIPGLFPPAEIPVTVDGQPFIELHGDGGVSTALFFHSPWLPPERRSDLTAANLYGTRVWCVVAGKLFADPEEVPRRALPIASNSVSTLIYSQTRGDLQRIFNLCLLNGMKFNFTSIPLEYPAPLSATEFDPPVLQAMFDEGFRLVTSDRAWRTTAPGVERGESNLERADIHLTHRDRGPATSSQGPPPLFLPPGPMPIPVLPGDIER